MTYRSNEPFDDLPLLLYRHPALLEVLRG